MKAEAVQQGARDGGDPGPRPGGGSGLRERKKAQTRRELRDGAARLFADQGFAGTTVADIAAAANVSERTFFRYFDGKEALLLPDAAEMCARIEDELAARPAQEGPVEAVCAALLAVAGSLADPAAGPVPVDLLVQAFDGFEERLTGLVAGRLPASTPDQDLHAAVLACACLSTVRAILRIRSARQTSGAPAADPAELLPAALGVLSRIGGAPAADGASGVRGEAGSGTTAGNGNGSGTRSDGNGTGCR
ncbi:TetR/AcrR family transcriptional regulator [Streptomyces sp. NPDC020917]|uniref:TetR/AcrR family transcriptional regulator n=1 Tax=Streptomyces sp. NPDC020917 TaxID=3365102 RepID=UPI0037880654